MALFLAEFSYSYWSGREDKQCNFVRLVNAPNLKMAKDRANKYWISFKEKSNYPSPNDLILDDIEVSEPLE